MRIRLTAITASVGMLVVAGCTSSSGSTPSSSTLPNMPTSTSSTPTESPSPSIIGLPTPTSTAVRRAVHRPPGAKPLHAIPGKPNCATAGGEANLVLTQIKGPLIYAPSTPEQSLSILRTMGPFLVKPRRDAVTVRGQWLAAGYPASYPAIQDLDAIISAFDRLAVAAKAEDLNAMSKIYQDLNSASDQYAFDGDDCV